MGLLSFFQLLTLLLTLFDFPRNKNNHAAHKPRGYRILYGGDKEDRTPDLLHAISKFPENKLNQPHMYYLNSTNSLICPMSKILMVATAIQKLTFIG